MRPTGRDQGREFEGWLRQQLHATLDEERGPRPRPAQARYQAAARGRMARFVAALGARVAVGGAVVALGAGATAGTVATGSVNPVNWGQRVVQQVQQCEQQAAGSRGQCVSASAQQHGQAVQAQHAEPAESPSAGTAVTATPGAHRGEGVSHASASSAAAQGQGQDTATTSHGGNGRAEGRPTPTASPKG